MSAQGSLLPWCSPWQKKISFCWPPLDLHKGCSIAYGDSYILAGIPWSRYLPHPGLGLDNLQAISKRKVSSHAPIPTKRLIVPWGGVSCRAIKSISNLVDFPFPHPLNYLLLPVVQSPPMVSPSRVLKNPPYLSPIHLNIPRMTLLFHHLIQITHNPSRYLFTFFSNTRGYPSITHLSHKYEWVPLSLALVEPSSLIMRASPLKVSIYVPNDTIPWSSGTAFAYGWTFWIYPVACNTVQEVFAGIDIKNLNVLGLVE